MSLRRKKSVHVPPFLRRISPGNGLLHLNHTARFARNNPYQLRNQPSTARPVNPAEPAELVAHHFRERFMSSERGTQTRTTTVDDRRNHDHQFEGDSAECCSSLAETPPNCLTSDSLSKIQSSLTDIKVVLGDFYETTQKQTLKEFEALRDNNDALLLKMSRLHEIYAEHEKTRCKQQSMVVDLQSSLQKLQVGFESNDRSRLLLMQSLSSEISQLRFLVCELSAFLKVQLSKKRTRRRCAPPSLTINLSPDSKLPADTSSTTFIGPLEPQTSQPAIDLCVPSRFRQAANRNGIPASDNPIANRSVQSFTSCASSNVTTRQDALARCAVSTLEVCPVTGIGPTPEIVMDNSSSGVRASKRSFWWCCCRQLL